MPTSPDLKTLEKEEKRDKSIHQSGLDGLRGRPVQPVKKPMTRFELTFPWLGKVESKDILHDSLPSKNP